MKASPSKACKQAGMRSLTQLSEMSGTSIQTLSNWYKNKRALFDLVMLGASHRATEGLGKRHRINK